MPIKSGEHCEDIVTRAQRVGFFQYRAGLCRVLKKSQVEGGFGSGMNVEIFDRVFLGVLFIIGNFRVFLDIFGYFRVFLCILSICHVQVYPMIFKTESGGFGY